MPRFSLRTLVVVMLLAVSVCPGEEPPTEGHIRDLIARLASPNERPSRKSGSFRYPPRYDKEAQEGVYRAWSELYAIGFPAFPELIDSLDDDRYSLTEANRWTGALENMSVGRTCHAILKSYLQPCNGPYHEEDSDRPKARPDYCQHFELRHSGAFQEWWESRRDKSLRELQLEVMEWVVTEESKYPEYYSEREREYLSDLLGKMKNNGRTLKPTYPFGR